MEPKDSTPQRQLEDEFLAALADYSPTIPEELTEYCLKRSGFQTSDQKMVKLVSLAAEKFISDIAQDAMCQAKLRQQKGAVKKTPEGKEKITLTMEDLQLSLKDYGVEINKPPYYASKPGAVKEKKDGTPTRRAKAY